MRDFRKYDIWTLSMDLVVEIYSITNTFPVIESYGLSAQLQRASVSIPSNIAEGASRSSNADFCRFLEIALGSAFEAETQLILANRLGYINNQQLKDILSRLETIQRKTNNLLQTIKN